VSQCGYTHTHTKNGFQSVSVACKLAMAHAVTPGRARTAPWRRLLRSLFSWRVFLVPAHLACPPLPNVHKTRLVCSIEHALHDELTSSGGCSCPTRNRHCHNADHFNLQVLTHKGQQELDSGKLADLDVEASAMYGNPLSPELNVWLALGMWIFTYPPAPGENIWGFTNAGKIAPAKLTHLLKRFLSVPFPPVLLTPRVGHCSTRA
jgi:hypothetical protein